MSADMQMTDGTCALCGISWAESDVVPINPAPDKLGALRERLDSRQASRTKPNSKRKRMQGNQDGIEQKCKS